MKPPRVNRLTFQTAKTLAVNEWLASFRSPGMYIVATLACLIQIQILTAPLSFLRDYGLLITQDPLIPAFLGAMAVIVLYAAIIAAISIVNEREKRTLQVLFYTPVSHQSLVLAKYLAQLLSSLSLLSITVIFLAFTAWITKFPMGLDLFWALLLSIFLVSAMVAFGLSISAYARSVRGAVLLFLILLVLLFGLQIFGRVLDQVLPVSNPNLLVYLTPALDVILFVTAQFSPLAYLLRGLEAVALSSSLDYLLSALLSLTFSAVFLWLTFRLSHWRGVV